MIPLHVRFQRKNIFAAVVIENVYENPLSNNDMNKKLCIRVGFRGRNHIMHRRMPPTELVWSKTPCQFVVID